QSVGERLRRVRSRRLTSGNQCHRDDGEAEEKCYAKRNQEMTHSEESLVLISKSPVARARDRAGVYGGRQFNNSMQSSAIPGLRKPVPPEPLMTVMVSVLFPLTNALAGTA